MCTSEFQGPAPAWDLWRGVPSLACHSRGRWCLFKKKTKPPNSVRPRDFLSSHGSFLPPGSAPACHLHSCVSFAQWPVCKHRRAKGGTKLAFQSPSCGESSVCKCSLPFQALTESIQIPMTVTRLDKGRGQLHGGCLRTLVLALFPGPLNGLAIEEHGFFLRVMRGAI